MVEYRKLKLRRKMLGRENDREVNGNKREKEVDVVLLR